MNGTIECAFIGRVGTEPELKTSQAGKPWCRFSVAVGADDATQWVQVACFGERAEKLAGSLNKGDRCYVEGSIRLNEWTGKDGEKRAGLSVAAWKCEKLGQIGRNKPPKAKNGDGTRDWQAPPPDPRSAAEHRPSASDNDAIPF
jgi:single-strand DNA-binding protein